MYVYTPYGCFSPSEGVEVLGTGVEDSWEPPSGCWEPNLSPLQKQKVLLTAEYLFSLHLLIFLKFKITFLCGCMCQSTCVFRGQPAWVGYVFMPFGSQGLNSVYQTWWQASIPPSHLINLLPLLISEATCQSKYRLSHCPPPDLYFCLSSRLCCHVVLWKSETFTFGPICFKLQLFYSAAMALEA